MSTPPAPRRGRLPRELRERRRAEVIAAARDELVERGAAGLTMEGVARRAGASKETLYAWFGTRDDLIGAVIEATADDSAQRVQAALAADASTLDDARDTLTSYAQSLLRLLTSEPSVSLNRAAMTSAVLSDRLLQSGRQRIGPVVERYLAHLDAHGILRVPDPGGAYRTLFGLVVRDTQIRVLLGDPPPKAGEIRAHAKAAVHTFLALHVRPRG